MATTEEDSYEEYKKYLEDSLGIYGIPPPPRPLTPYMYFFFQRNCQEKSKGNPNIIELSRTLGEEWKKMPQKKKSYYQEIYNIKSRQREQLLEQYELLTKKKKPASGYVRYYKKRFRELSKDNSSLDIKEISKMVTSDWKNLKDQVKDKYVREAAEETANRELTPKERQEAIEAYNQKVGAYAEQIAQEKQKILKKYGLSNRKELKLAEREKKREAKKMERYQQKLKREEEKKKKKKEELEAKKKQKEEEKNKKKSQKETKKVEAKPAAAKATAKSKTPIVKKQVQPENVKRPAAKAAKAKKSKPKAKKAATKKAKVAKASKLKKTKPIKKAAKAKPVKKEKVEVKKEVKKEVKQEVKQPPPKGKKPPVKPKKDKKK